MLWSYGLMMRLCGKEIQVDENMVTIKFPQDIWEEMVRYAKEDHYDTDNDVENWVFEAVKAKLSEAVND